MSCLSEYDYFYWIDIVIRIGLKCCVVSEAYFMSLIHALRDLDTISNKRQRIPK